MQEELGLNMYDYGKDFAQRKVLYVIHLQKLSLIINYYRL